MGNSLNSNLADTPFNAFIIDGMECCGVQSSRDEYGHYHFQFLRLQSHYPSQFDEEFPLIIYLYHPLILYGDILHTIQHGIEWSTHTLYTFNFCHMTTSILR